MFDGCCRVRLCTDGEVMWLPPAALVPLIGGRRRQRGAAAEGPASFAPRLVEGGGTVVLPHEFSVRDRCRFKLTVHLDRIPAGASMKHFFIGVVASDMELPPTAAPFEIRERSFCAWPAGSSPTRWP